MDKEAEHRLSLQYEMIEEILKAQEIPPIEFINNSLFCTHLFMCYLSELGLAKLFFHDLKEDTKSVTIDHLALCLHMVVALAEGENIISREP